MVENPLLIIAVIGLLGILSQWIAWITRQPAILYLLLTGIIIGPVTDLLDPDLLFGDLLFPFVSLAVAIILFEGSLTLRFNELKGLGVVVRNLISLGAVTTWIVTAYATHFLLGFSYELSFLFGAIVVVTGPTVIMPMLRTVRPNEKIANVLRWEGIVIDPLGALLAVLVFDFIISQQSGNALGIVAITFATLVLTGTGIGFFSALLLGFLLRNHFIPEYLRSVFALVLLCMVFAISDFIVHESGLLAVTIMGITLANLENTEIEDILDFKESLSVLLISVLFIILAARIEFYQIYEIGWYAAGILAIIMVLARPLAVLISTVGSNLTFSEKFIISWIGPRGIVAAAVASLFSIRLENSGYPDAVYLVPLTFLVIIGTVVIQSATAKTLARWLNVREPPPTGLLIIGAGNVAREIGKTLQEHDVKVVLTDSSWENTRIARMDGLNTYYGNPISEHAESHLALSGIGKMLAMSGRAYLDSLASFRFKSDFGKNNVYELRTSVEKQITEKHRTSSRHRGHYLFGEDITYGLLATWLRNNAKIHSTQLSDEYSFEKYLDNYKDRIIPLFAIDNKGKLQIFVAEDQLIPESGWTVISLIRPENTVQPGSRGAHDP